MANQSDIKVKIGDYPGPVIRVGSYPGPSVRTIQYGSQTLRTLSDVDARVLTDGFGLVYSSANDNFYLTNLGATSLLLSNVANLQIALSSTNANVSNLQISLSSTNANVSYISDINATQNTNISNIRTYLESNVAYIAGVDTTQNTNISNIRTYLESNVAYIAGVDTTQNTNISNLGTYLNSNVAYIAGVDATQNTNINNIRTYLDSNVASIAGVDASQNTRISNIESGLSSNVAYIAGVDVSQNTNISNLRTYLDANVLNMAGVNTTQNTSITNLSSYLNSNVAYIAGVDATQNTNITNANTLAQSAYTLAGTKFNSNGGTIAGSVTIQNNLTVLGNVSYTGNVISVQVSGNTGQFFGYAANGFNALYAGIPTGYFIEPQISFQVSSNYNGYAGINMQNINSGSNSSSDLFITADNGTINDGFVDLGMGSSTYSYPGYNLIGKNDGYLFATGNTTTGGGNMIIGTGLPHDIIFATGGITTTNEVMRITSANTVVIKTQVPSTSTTTGALQVKGGLGVTGNVYANNVTVDSLTTNQAVFTDANKKLVSVATTGTGSVVLSTNPTLGAGISILGGDFNNNILIGSAMTNGQITIGSESSTGGYLVLWPSINGGNLYLHSASLQPDKTATTYINSFTGGGSSSATATRNIYIGHGEFYSTVNVVIGSNTLKSNTTLNGRVNVSSTTASTSNTTGALVVAGGLGVSGNVYANAVFSAGLPVLTTEPIGSSASANTIYTFGVDATQNTNISNLRTYLDANVTYIAGVDATQNTNIQLAWNTANTALPNTGGTVTGNVSFLLAQYDNIVIGNTKPTKLTNTTIFPKLQLIGAANASNTTILIEGYSTSALLAIPTLAFHKVANNTIGNGGQSGVNHRLGSIDFYGTLGDDDKANTAASFSGFLSAQIRSTVDKTPVFNTNYNSNTIPASLTFLTQPSYDGLGVLNAPVSRATISSNGNINFGTYSGSTINEGQFGCVSVTKSLTKWPTTNSMYGLYVVTQQSSGTDLTNINDIVQIKAENSSGVVNYKRAIAFKAEGIPGEVGVYAVYPTVNTQIGFLANNNIIGANNNYGFISDLTANTSGTQNTWNFYASGNANNYFAGTTTFGKDISVNGITVGRGVGNVETNLIVGNTSSPFLTSANYNNTVIGSGALKAAGKSIRYLGAITGGQSYNGTFYNNVVLEYLSGTPVLPGGQYPTVNISIAEGGGVDGCSLVNAGSGFVDTTTRFKMPAGLDPTGTGFSIGINSLIATTDTIAIGTNAGYNIGGSSQGIFIGAGATGTGGSINEIAIGCNSVGSGDNSVTIGNQLTTATWLKGNAYVSGLFVRNTDYYGNIVGGLLETQYLQCNQDFNLFGSAENNAEIASNQRTGGLYIGGYGSSGAMGTIELGRSSGTQTVGIAVGVNTVSSRIKTVNIGTGATGGNTNINIGPSAATGPTNIVIGCPTGSSNTKMFGTVLMANTRASTSNTTGALVVTGGVGIGGNLYANTIVSSNVSIGTTLGVSTIPLQVEASVAGDGIRVTRRNLPSQYLSITTTDGSQHLIQSFAEKPFKIINNSTVFNTEFYTNTNTLAMSLLPSGNVGISGNTNISGTLTGTGSLQLTGSTTGNQNIATSQTSGTLKIGGTGGSVWIGQYSQSIRIGYNPDYIFGHAFAFSAGSVSLGTGGQNVEIGTEDSEAFSRSTTTFKGDVNLSAAQSVNYGNPTINLGNAYNLPYSALSGQPVAVNDPYSTLTYASTITPIPNTNRRITCTGNLTINAPSTSGVADGAVIRLWIIASGADRTVSLQNTIKIPRSSFFTSPQTIISGDKARLSLQFDIYRNVWELVSFVNGY